MKNRIISLIIADRTRVLTLLVSGAIALSGVIAVRLFGVELTVEHQSTIALLVTLVFGWVIEAWAADQNSKGVAQIQIEAKKIDPSVKVDGHAGTETIAAAVDIVKDLKEKT